MDQHRRDKEIRAVNRWLRDAYPGPFGPKYWLFDDGDGGVVVRGWGVERDGKPMGEHLALCRSMAEALAWIEAAIINQ
ncbi:hypothetical protein [Acidithiobacillus ferrooxidans]|uniref:Uncharacterized protein n=1 Tax=Acidithiobacillus ferrooxidans TaxID=920 RepID=A0A2W1K4T6_ACIFR|nr:hypothetical protein [Acidithiobacillus ferrooxidans]MCR1341711.1 hypothetical protein [Acidithiobacillus ferrooxidans]PZD81858.1 hypothetical protein DN052_01940 [Acidithiobacillus ferrooxidans]QLK41852.1 hypothetical protein FE661_06555 [Acidithiobacillus ferrooxidans]QZT53807.1 hypothetical protein K7B00_06525 [Acidithiobacillus ferrooxidans]BDB13992.1 hypothetical protein ANFP_13120 [Acidithiobacillus ferrooxidans]